ncbi:MAG: DUF3445 domain-containing protein [Actinomycetota bacterium]
MSGSPLRYFPVDGRPWRLTMGLRPLDMNDWLEFDQHRDQEIAQKQSLLQHSYDAVAAVEEESHAAQVELAQMIENVLEIEGLNSDRQSDRELPIVWAARHIQEDLCILEHDGMRWRLTAACVCFPSRWNLQEKIGRTLQEIHGPVPGYDEDLDSPVEDFFNRLSVDRPKWRLNWTVLDTNELHLPSPSARRALELPNDLGDLTFRVERQTLIRLPLTNAVVFTIRNYTAPLHVLGDRPSHLSALKDTLKTVNPEVADYKGWNDLLLPLLTWLELKSRSQGER